MSGEQELKILCNQIAREANQILAQEQMNHAQKFIKTAIATFHAAYDPVMYTRQDGSLEKFAHPQIQNGKNGDIFTFDFGPEYSGGYDNTEAVYFWVFKKGYHGGAPSGTRHHMYYGQLISMPHPHPGIPYWGTPTPYYSLWYGIPAPQSTSPYEMIKQQWMTYIKGAYQRKKDEVKQQMVRKYLFSIKNVLIRMQNK